MFIFFVEFNSKGGFLLLIVHVKGHPVEVEAFPRSQVDIILLLSECTLYGLLTLKLLIAYFNEQSYHLPNLVVDKALADKSEPQEAHPMALSLLLLRVQLLQAILDSFRFDQFHLHGHYVSVALGVVLLVPLGEVVEAMGPQIKRSEMVQLCKQFVLLKFIQRGVVSESLLTQEQFQRGEVVVNPGAGIMTHVESFTYPLDCEYPYIHGQVSIDILCNLVQIKEALFPVDDISAVEFEAAGNAVAKGVNLFVRSACSRPFDSAQVVHVSLQDEALLAQNFVQDVFDCVVGVPLVLKSKEALAIVAEEQPQLSLYALLHRLSNQLSRLVLCLMPIIPVKEGLRMEPDFRRFCLNREIFPREPSSSSSRLICGHLNRLKFPPQVDTYLQARRQGANMHTALARANRCFCRGDQRDPRRAADIDFGFTDSKELIRKLEDMEIRVRRLRDD